MSYATQNYLPIDDVEEIIKTQINTIYKPFIGASHLSQLLTDPNTKPLILTDQQATFWGVYMQNKLLSFLAHCLKLTFSPIKYTPIIQHPSGLLLQSTPDALLRNQIKDYPLCLVEVKCPANGILPVKMRSSDYLQIQAHLASKQYKNSICLYIVWSPFGLIMNLVKPDPDFFNITITPFINSLLTKLQGNATNYTIPILSNQTLKDLQLSSIERSVTQIFRCFFLPNEGKYPIRASHWFIPEKDKFFTTPHKSDTVKCIELYGDKIFKWNMFVD